MSDGLPARKIAYDIFSDILKKKLPFDQVLDAHRDFPSLDPRDRGFVYMLVATALRHLGECDTLIDRLQNKKNDKEPPIPLQHILRLGLTQILYMDVPSHAAVDTSVRLCEALRMDKYKSFVNALLRRTLREQDKLTRDLDTIRLNIPNWLYKALEADWGKEDAYNIAAASLIEAPFDLTIKNSVQVSSYAQEMDAKQLFSNTLRLSSRPSVTELPGYVEGDWWVQDASAALPAALFGDIAGKTVFDICAAPGGKTAQLAAAGAKVTALDRSANRLKRLHENMERLGLGDQVDVQTQDAAAWEPDVQADAVLIDAPCSSTGILRRHPDILHLKSKDDVTALANTQRRIFDQSAKMVKSGGVLIYCTCSILKEEGEDQAEAFLENHPEFNRSPITADEIGGYSELLNDKGEVRILPIHLEDLGGLDGFFIARFQKAS